MFIRKTTSVIIVFWLIISFLLNPMLAMADAPVASPDLDGDGLSNAVETDGWYNGAGGPFITDPLDPDSDNDGLTDGEEKLFDTNPNLAADPGTFVEYQNSFKTRQYFDAYNYVNPIPWSDPTPSTGGYFQWLQGGPRRLLTEAAVVRRGAGSFFLKAPAGSSLSIQKANTGQDNLTYTLNACQGGWLINVPATTRPVGTYTATVTAADSSWSKSFPIHVIFELPTATAGITQTLAFTNVLSPQDILTFGYDDDSANTRDETSIWWHTGEYRTENSQGLGRAHFTYGFAQQYSTDQFRKYIFRDLVMPAISGRSTASQAANALISKADYEVRVDYDVINPSSFYTLYRTPAGYQPEGGGGACQDNANLLTGFYRSAGLLARPFIVDWVNRSSVVVNGRTTGDYNDGFTSYSTGWYDTSAMVWLNNQWLASRSYGGGEQPASDPYPWPSSVTNPRTFAGFYSDQAGDLIISANSEWNFKSEQNGMVNDDPWGSYLSGDLDNLWNDLADGAANRDYLWHNKRPLYLLEMNPAVIPLSKAVWGAGRLVRTNYPISYTLPSPYPGGDIGLNWPIDPDPRDCPAGVDPCPFSGDNDGLGTLEVEVPETNFVPYTSPPANQAVKLNDSYNLHSEDSNGDSLVDTIVVEVGLQVISPGEHSLSAELYDAQGDWVGRASWSGSGTMATLPFENSAGKSGPFTLQRLHLFRSPLGLVDSADKVALPVSPDLVSGPVNLGVMPPIGAGDLSAQGLTITPTLSFIHSSQDNDGDGKIDALTITAGMTVAQAGTYRLEGWLMDAAGKLVAWAQGAPAALNTGNQMLSMSFDGAIISEHGVDGPYTLVGLKVLDGNLSAYNLLDQAQETGYTLTGYTADQFQSTLRFNDNMENGASQWTWTAPWSLNNVAAYSPANAWRAAGTQTGNLNTTNLNLSNYTQPVLRFTSCVSQTVNGAVEISTNGSTWTRVATYTTSSPTWSTRQLNLSAFSKSPMQIRFNAQSGSSWFVDNVRLNAWPALTGVDFSRLPAGTVMASQPVTFTAVYSSVSTSLPITYTWNFDGDVITTTTPTYVYSSGFEGTGDHPVTLTVQNPYDSASVSQIVGSGVAVEGIALEYGPAVPQINTTVNFTATATPLDATNTLTHPLVYSWDFGDGITATTTTTQTNHTYSAGGSYTVKVTGSNGYGVAQQEQQLQIKEAVESVVFTYQPDLPQEDDPVTFAASFSRPSATQPISYTWSFGDDDLQIAGNDSTITHTFANPGFYTVMVTATNGYSQPVTYAEVVTIDGRPVTSAAFTYAQANSGEPNKAAFTAAYEPSTATQPVTYTWDFGGGVISPTTATTIIYNFPISGTHLVTLTVTNGYGAPAIYSAQVIVPFDDDGDGLDNRYELETSHTNPANPDTDGDSRTDGEEVIGYTYTGYSTENYNQTIYTDPTIADTDGDGLDDGQEFSQNTDPLVQDTDEDGLFDGVEQGNGAPNPLDPDTDDDGLSDGDEMNLYLTNPLRVDTDNDGLNDAVEIGLGTDPNSSDSDNDGISDAVEVGPDPNNPSNTDANSPIAPDAIIDALDTDSDADGILDSLEGVDDPDDDGVPNYRDDDSDGDNIDDIDEAASLLDSNIPADSDDDGTPDFLDTDSDDDGIPDAVELLGNPDNDLWPNYLDTDSDNDGITDAAEWDNDQNGSTADDFCSDVSLDTDADGVPNCQDNDVDGDTTDNYLDDDSDGDGSSDQDEGDGDNNSDGIPDYLDGVAPLAPTENKTYLPIVIKN